MTKQKIYFFALVSMWFLIPSISLAQVQTARYIQMSEATKGFYEYLPQGYPEAGKKYPLLLFIHGYGECGDGTASSLPIVLRNGPPKLIDNGSFPVSFTVNNQTYKFIVISPQFTGFPSVNDINNSINYLIAYYPIDINRIYLTGLSMGGGVAWYYPGYNAYFANRIAATVPVCGAESPNSTYVNNIASSNLPVWATHNVGDQTVPVSNTENFVNQINAWPVPPNPLAKKTIFNVSGHDAWTQTYDPAFKENGLNVYEWMLQYSRNFVILPVTGLEINIAKNATNHILLSWKTTTEINNRGFNILRSSDGNTFTTIGYIASKAMNGAGASYTFNDPYPLSGNNFYRLEMINTDNQKTLSEIKLIQLDLKAEIFFYPNPVKSAIKIVTSKPFNNAHMIIRNAKGQIAISQILNGSTNKTISVDKFPTGVYFVEIIEVGNQQCFKFIKN